MSATPDSALANPEQLIADLQRQSVMLNLPNAKPSVMKR
jgi:hypothetical protein